MTFPSSSDILPAPPHSRSIEGHMSFHDISSSAVSEQMQILYFQLPRAFVDWRSDHVRDRHRFWMVRHCLVGIQKNDEITFVIWTSETESDERESVDEAPFDVELRWDAHTLWRKYEFWRGIKKRWQASLPVRQLRLLYKEEMDLAKGIANKSMVIFYQISVGIITIIIIPYTYGIAWYSEYIGTKLS